MRERCGGSKIGLSVRQRQFQASSPIERVALHGGELSNVRLGALRLRLLKLDVLALKSSRHTVCDVQRQRHGLIAVIAENSFRASRKM